METKNQAKQLFSTYSGSHNTSCNSCLRGQIRAKSPGWPINSWLSGRLFFWSMTFPMVFPSFHDTGLCYCWLLELTGFLTYLLLFPLLRVFFCEFILKKFIAQFSMTFHNPLEFQDFPGQENPWLSLLSRFFMTRANAASRRKRDWRLRQQKWVCF